MSVSAPTQAVDRTGERGRLLIFQHPPSIAIATTAQITVSALNYLFFEDLDFKTTDHFHADLYFSFTKMEIVFTPSKPKIFFFAPRSFARFSIGQPRDMLYFFFLISLAVFC